jgi:PKD repeat protein
MKQPFTLFALFFYYSFFAQNANFTLSKNKACVGETVTLTSTSTPGSFPIVNYIWSAQGADIESAEGPNMTTFSFTYSIPGTYNIGLIIQDANGVAANEFKIDALTISANPIASANYNIIGCNAPFNVSFNASGSSTGSDINYQWSTTSGNPTTSTGNPVSVTYANQGNYTANLTVTNTTTTCKATNTVSLNAQNFEANFTLPESACQGQTFLFNNTSSQTANQFLWTLSTGQTSTAQNLSTVINQTGNIEITLLATNSVSGCSDQITKTINVKTLPTPSFTFTPSLSCSPLVVSFTNTSTQTAGNQYVWDFGDGSPTFTGQTPPNHTYTGNNSIFFPKLTINGSNGCSRTFTGDTVLLFKPEAYFRFKSSDVNGCAPYTIGFQNVSYEPSPITSYYWDFGDGTTSNLQNPTHVYECGIFIPKLVITDNKGCKDSLYVNQNHYNFYILNGIKYASNRPDTFLLQVNGTSIQRIPTNFEDYYLANFGIDTSITNSWVGFYPIFDLRYGEKFDLDFTYEPAIQCASLPIEFTATRPDCPHESGEVQYTYNFEGFDSGSGSNFYSKLFLDTLKTNTLMDVEVEATFRGCKSDKKTKEDIIYLKGPVSKFSFSNICNLGPGAHTLTINDSKSIYGHENSQTVLGEYIPSQTEDDVEVIYEWGDGTQTIITNDNELEDENKGATSHTYPIGYGEYFISQEIINHTTGCSFKNIIPFNIAYTNITIDFDISGQDDSICYKTPFKIIPNVESSQTLQEHDFYIYRNNANTELITFFRGFLPQTSFPENGIDYLEPGVYEVKVITNPSACMDSAFNKLTVFKLPIASINLLSDTVCKQNNVQFNPSNSILGDWQTWSEFRWGFSDGRENVTSTALNSNLSQQVNDNLIITLQVVDGFGCVSDNIDSAYVTAIKPTASFSNKQYLCNDTEESINGSSSIGIEPMNYEWSLNGQLISSSNESILTNTIIVSPPDTTKMNYIYQLIVTDAYGCIDTLEKSVLVSNPRVASVDTVVSAKYIDANGNFTCPPVVVDFDLTYESNWPIETIMWSFGNDFDEDIDSYNEDPTGIQYVRAGSYTYTVYLTETVTGCQFQRTDSPFLVIGGPRADVLITADTTDVCGVRFYFEVLNASDNLDYWSWNLDDGTSQNSIQNPSNSFYHVYNDNQTYNPIITLLDDSTNCQVPITLNVEVLDNGLNAYFTANPMEVNMGFSVVFNDGSNSQNSTITNWVWNYGDGVIDTMNTNASVSHQYITKNSTNVVLTIIDEFGCEDQYSLPLKINVEAILPNILTGIGGNGANSIWTLFADIFIDFELLIVNRWGNVVYEAKKDPNNPLFLWDGIDSKSGKPCVDGVYFYILKGTLVDGRPVDFQDYLTIVGSER